MIKKSLSKKIILRRFKEIFYQSEPGYFNEKSLDLFITRVADFYELLKTDYKGFIKYQNRQSKYIQKRMQSKTSEIDIYFKKVGKILDGLGKNNDFIKIISNGEKKFNENINKGVHTPGADEIIYQYFDFELKVLTKNIPPQKITLDQATRLVNSFQFMIIELEEYYKTIIVPNISVIKSEGNNISTILKSIQDDISRKFNFERINSFQEVEQTWLHVYDSQNISDFFGLKLAFAKDDINSRKRIIDDLSIHVKRLLHSVFDWLDRQNYIDEALIDFKIWSELVDNNHFLEIYKKGNSRKKEELLKDEFSKFLFSTYKILCIREIILGRKKADAYFQSKENKIIGEAKFIDEKTGKRGLTTLVHNGLLQLSRYTSAFNIADSFVLLVFNFSKTNISNQILSSNYLGKPIFLLPLNMSADPSNKGGKFFTKKDFELLLKKI